MLPRILAVAIGLLLASLIGWLALEKIPDDIPPAIELLDGRDILYELGQNTDRGNLAGLGAMRGKLGHLLLNEYTANSLFNIEERKMQYDPQAYYRRPPFQNLTHKWAQHPAGEWSLVTNSLGLREQRELSRERLKHRIFVTGDSHTDGVCNTDESYPHLLEAELLRARPDEPAEAYNAGVGGYSFYNYLGAFDRFREFGMNTYIVGVYGGNDFLGVLGPHRFFQGMEIPAPIDNAERVNLAKLISAPALSQGFFAYSNFAERPADEALALEAATEVTLALAKRCDNQNVRLIVVYIPPMYDTRPEVGEEQTKQLREIFDLSDEEMQVTERQANAYLEALRREDVEVIDMRPAFKAAEVSPYWIRDHHIDLQGHRLIADALAPLFD
jgi:hypothetical protein